MTKFEMIKRGLEANAAARTKIADDERSALENSLCANSRTSPKNGDDFVGDPRARGMTTAEIITACNVGHSPEGDGQSPNKGYLPRG